MCSYHAPPCPCSGTPLAGAPNQPIPNSIPLVAGAWTALPECSIPVTIVPIGHATAPLWLSPNKPGDASSTDSLLSTAFPSWYTIAGGSWWYFYGGSAGIRATLHPRMAGTMAPAVMSVATHTAVVAGVASTALLAANPIRTYALFVNDGPTAVYIALNAVAALNTGIRLNASGGSYEIDCLNMYRGAVNVIGTAVETVLVTEAT